MHPRQRLLRDAIVCAAGGGVLLIAALWWACTTSHPPGLELADARGPAPASAAPVAAVPTGRLWNGPPAVAAAPAPPPPPPAMRLLTLSHSGDAWVALIDPGAGGSPQRVGVGDQVAGWRVDGITGSSVALSSGAQRITLAFQP